MHENSNLKMKFYWLWIIPILLLSFALAIPHYTQDAVWFDEAYTHLYAGTGRVPERTIADSLLLIAKTDPWPPGYYLMSMAWGRLTGRFVFTDYVLPTLIGLIALSVIYQLGKVLFGEKQGIIASLMIACSAIFIHYTHENRAYTLYILVISVMALYYWIFVTRSNYRRRWLRWGFPLAIGASLYTHFVASAFVLGIIIYHLLCEHPSRSLNPHMNLKRWRDGIRLWINGCLLFTPWFAMLLGTLATESNDSRGLPLYEALQYIIYSFTNNLWFVFLLLFLGSISLWKMKQVRFLWVWFLGSALVVSIFHGLVGFLFHPRHVLAFILIMVLLIIPVLDKIEKHFKGLSTILVGLYAGAGIAFSMTPTFMYVIPTHTQPVPLVAMNEMQSVVDQCVQENDAVIFSIDDFGSEKIQNVALEYYFIGELHHFTQFGSLVTTINDNGQPEANVDMQGDIQEFISERDNIWMMHLPRVSNTPDIMQFNNLMSDLGYTSCPFEASTNINAWFYTTENNCEVMLNTCQ